MSKKKEIKKNKVKILVVPRSLLLIFLKNLLNRLNLLVIYNNLIP